MLGPLLFVVALSYMLSAIVSFTLTSFADDTNWSQVAKETLDTTLLQIDLKAIYIWAVENTTQFDDTKIQALRYQPKSKLQLKCIGSTGDTITYSESERDLGLHMNNDTTYRVHIAQLATQFKRTACWILRCFRDQRQRYDALLWKNFVLSRLEYWPQLC